jgi:hypothetical protein
MSALELRQQLLAAPAEQQLSKWQKKRQRRRHKQQHEQPQPGPHDAAEAQ